MNVICTYSGLSFNVEYFPGSLYGPEACHPIFHLPQKKLLAYIGKWAAGELTDIDSYLLFTAVLKSSDLVVFRTRVKRTHMTASIVANNMEGLVKIVSKLNVVQRAESFFPHYVVSPDTSDLSNVAYWIENWKDKYQEYLDGASRSSAHDMSKINRRDAALERMINNRYKPKSAYATQLAEWAAVAGSFPTFNTVSRFTGLKVTCAQYWQEIIVKCANDSGIYAVNDNDLKELIEHCRDNIPVGSLFAHTLFQIIDKAQGKLSNLLGFGDLDARKTAFTLLSAEDTVEKANMIALVQSAPEQKPKREQYPTQFAFMKAKMRWDMSQKFPQKAEEEGV
jgi:hypothetical protein